MVSTLTPCRETDDSSIPYSKAHGWKHRENLWRWHLNLQQCREQGAMLVNSHTLVWVQWHVTLQRWGEGLNIRKVGVCFLLEDNFLLQEGQASTVVNGCELEMKQRGNNMKYCVPVRHFSSWCYVTSEMLFKHTLWHKNVKMSLGHLYKLPYFDIGR